jgi:hypothetical protein
VKKEEKEEPIEWDGGEDMSKAHNGPENVGPRGGDGESEGVEVRLIDENRDTSRALADNEFEEEPRKYQRPSPQHHLKTRSHEQQQSVRDYTTNGC